MNDYPKIEVYTMDVENNEIPTIYRKSLDEYLPNFLLFSNM
jgi:hypothetical protein